MLHTKFQANCIIIPDKSPFNDDLPLKQNITKLGSEPLINRNILKELASVFDPYGFFSYPIKRQISTEFVKAHL